MNENLRPGSSRAIGIGDRSLAEVLDIAAGDTVRDTKGELGRGTVDRFPNGSHAIVDFASGRYCLGLDQLEVLTRAPRPAKAAETPR